MTNVLHEYSFLFIHAEKYNRDFDNSSKDLIITYRHHYTEKYMNTSHYTIYNIELNTITNNTGPANYNEVKYLLKYAWTGKCPDENEFIYIEPIDVLP